MQMCGKLRLFLQERINKVLDNSQFTLSPATSSPLWLRRHNNKTTTTTKAEKHDEKNESEYERSEKSDKLSESGSERLKMREMLRGTESEERSENLISFKDDLTRTNSAESEDSFNLYENSNF